MQTQSLTIEIPEGYQFDKVDAGKIMFKAKPKNVMERIKTVADVLTEQGFTQEEFDKSTETLTNDEKAYIILKWLAKSLNEGWTPDWNNSNEIKYVPWFYMGGSSGFQCYDCDGWTSSSDVGSRLCFKSRELAEYAGKQFTEVFKQFMLIP